LMRPRPNSSLLSKLKKQQNRTTAFAELCENDIWSKHCTQIYRCCHWRSARVLLSHIKCHSRPNGFILTFRFLRFFAELERTFLL
jgi:hypothetical protein